MNLFFYCALIFLCGYMINMFYITVLYHRGLTHGAVILSPAVLKFLEYTGVWVTGLDPKAWSTMHRLHHLHSDSKDDPHSPVHQGVFGVWVGQYKSYKNIIAKILDKTDLQINQVSNEIPIELSWISKHGFSNFPYYLHIAVGLLLVFSFGSVALGFAYVLGLLSHPVQGWMVNSLAHRYGRRNFPTNDHSKNNLFVAYFVFGEGLQNNHHAHPGRAKFSFKFPEFDAGYWMCWLAERVGLVKINRF